MIYMRRTTIYLSETNDHDLQVIRDYYEMSTAQVIRHLILLAAADIRRRMVREIELDIEGQENENETK